VRLKNFFGLIVCNLIWAANPLMGKFIMRDFAPAQTSWLRYASALLSYVLALLLLRRVHPKLLQSSRMFIVPRLKADVLWLLALGFLTFCFASLLQMIGLESSRAMDNALIVAIEPLLTVFLAWLLLKEAMKGHQWVSFAIALIGFSVLSGLTWERLSKTWDGSMWGNLIILTSLIGEATYSPISRKLIGRFHPMGLFGSALAVGVVFSTLVTAALAGLPSLDSFTTGSALGLLWIGPLGTTATYLFWMSVLSKESVPNMALTLYVQPVVGSLLGYLYLDERLTAVQALGAVLILVAISLPVIIEQKSKRHPAPGLPEPAKSSC
jgi:drug/metabolite transporter (DMT)-like permease